MNGSRLTCDGERRGQRALDRVSVAGRDTFDAASITADG